jgi:hypothetical protein
MNSADYAPHPNHRCPKCDSPDPHRHPSMGGHEGEVELCTHDYHLIPTNQNRPSFIADVQAKRAMLAARKDHPHA